MIDTDLTLKFPVYTKNYNQAKCQMILLFKLADIPVVTSPSTYHQVFQHGALFHWQVLIYTSQSQNQCHCYPLKGELVHLVCSCILFLL